MLKIKNTTDRDIYCCNGFCKDKDRCFRFQYRECVLGFGSARCLYLHKDKDNCLLVVKENKKE